MTMCMTEPIKHPGRFAGSGTDFCSYRNSCWCRGPGSGAGKTTSPSRSRVRLRSFITWYSSSRVVIISMELLMQVSDSSNMDRLDTSLRKSARWGSIRLIEGMRFQRGYMPLHSVSPKERVQGAFVEPRLQPGYEIGAVHLPVLDIASSLPRPERIPTMNFLP